MDIVPQPFLGGYPTSPLLPGQFGADPSIVRRNR